MENGGLCISDFSPVFVVLLRKTKYSCYMRKDCTEGKDLGCTGTQSRWFVPLFCFEDR